MSDERIDRVLRELGGARAEDGIELRVARAVEQRVAPARATADGRGLARLWSAVWSRAAVDRGELRARWVLGGAMIAAVLAAMMALGPLRRPPLAIERGPLVEEPEIARRSAAGAGLPAAGDGGLLVTRRPIGSRPRTRTLGGHAGAVRGQTAAERQNVVEASYAPTLVAPPLPLTRQERSLLRVVRRGDPEEREALDARVRDAQLVAEKAEVDAFFKPPQLPKQDQ